MYVYVYTHAYCARMYIYKCVRVYVCMYMCTYVYIYLYIYIYICIYIHIYIGIYPKVEVADEVLCLMAMDEFDGVEVL